MTIGIPTTRAISSYERSSNSLQDQHLASRERQCLDRIGKHRRSNVVRQRLVASDGRMNGSPDNAADFSRRPRRPMLVLIAAVEAGSLSAAGRRLGAPLATVSRKVSELEAHLGTRLLTRTRQGLTLTDAGRSYVAACKRILEDIEEAERAASGEYRAPKGDLTITAPIVLGRLHVLPVLIEFLQTYPDIDIRMLQADRVTRLLEEDVNVAIRIGELPDSSLVATRVGAIRRVVCASPAYFAARGTPTRPEELAAYDYITFDGWSSPSAWTFTSCNEDARVKIHSRLTVNTAEAAIDAAIAGLGITRVLSYQVAAAIQEDALAIALTEFEPPPWPVSLVFAGQRLLPLKLQAFLDFAAPRLQQRLSEHKPREAVGRERVDLA